MRKIAIYTLVFLFGCDIPIDLDVEQTTPMPVIEAQVTDKKGNSYVRVTMTIPFYDTQQIPTRSDATVSLEEIGGATTLFQHYNGTNTDSLGYYFPPDDFAGEVSKDYRITITVDGTDYIAEDTMLPVNPIDSLEAKLNVLEASDPEEEDRYWEVLLYSKEPQDTKDFYLFRFYRNWELTRNFETDIYVAEDIALGEELNGIPFPFFYAEQDTSVIEIYGITREAFVYYSDLQIALTNDGGMFSPPPANPRTNFSNPTPGFFLLASVSSDTLIVE